MPISVLAPVLALLAPAVAADGAPVQVPFEKFELANGLDVVLIQDNDVPVVHVEVWYHVGSKDEVAGRTGFAHLYEHLMFQGSAHMNADYFQPLQRVGARVNGTTNNYRTNYFETLPSEHLPLALWLESDRMGWLLPVLDEAKLTNQQDVVRNERRQRVENPPFGDWYIRMFENLYPVGHPLHHPVIGAHEDLEAATLEDVKAFYQTWYVPNNATLCIAGDFDHAVAKAEVEKWFSEIPAGPQPKALEAMPVELAEEKVVRVEDDVPYSRVWLGWPSPELHAKGDAELDVLSSVLSDGKDSRLYRRLVIEKKIAKDVSASQWSMEVGSAYILDVTAAPGVSTDTLVAEVDAVLAELRESGPTADEVQVALTNWEASFVRRLGTVAAKAGTLCSYNVLEGDPGYLDEDLARYQAVTPAAVRQAVNDLLPAAGRVVLHYTPGEAK